MNDDPDKVFKAGAAIEQAGRCFRLSIIAALMWFTGGNMQQAYCAYHSHLARAEAAYSRLLARHVDFTRGSLDYDRALRETIEADAQTYDHHNSLLDLYLTVLIRFQNTLENVTPPEPLTGIEFWKACAIANLEAENQCLCDYSANLAELEDGLNDFIDAGKVGMQELTLMRLRNPIDLDSLEKKP